MKCHTCQQELVKVDPPLPCFDTFWECPQLHVLRLIINQAGEITAYMLFWDDIEKDLRYRLESESNHTNLRQRPLTQPENRKMEHIGNPGFIGEERPIRWSIVMTIKDYLPLSVKDDVIQVGNLIPRLMKLRAFS
jgi:hypothetical protein